MDQNSNNSQPDFKVVDRRVGNSGESKDTRDLSSNAAKEKVAHETSKKNADKEVNKSPEQAERPPMSFTLFIQTLTHQAMMGLGMVPWPDSGLIKQDLVLAKETVDILDILKQKCAGNLDAGEQAMLDGILYQLHVAFVENSKSDKTPKKKSIIE